MLEEAFSSTILTDVERAVTEFDEIATEQRRKFLCAVINRLCSIELSHVVEIVLFLQQYQETHPTDGGEVLLMGAEELIAYLAELRQCIPKSGCTLLVYSLLEGQRELQPQTQGRINKVTLALEDIVKEVASIIAHLPLCDDQSVLAALFEFISTDVLQRIMDEAYTSGEHTLRNICDFIEHLPCIDQQIKACLALYRRMSMDSNYLRVGATVLAYRTRKVMQYADFARAKHAVEMRKLKLQLPEGVYAITWNYASISVTSFMVPKSKYERIAEVKCKPVTWNEQSGKSAKHEFQTCDNGQTFVIKNSDSGLFLTDVSDTFCYAERSDDTWTVEVIKRGEDVMYKIANVRTGNALPPTTDVQLDLGDRSDGFNLVDFNERALVGVQKFELNRAKPACVLQ